MVTSIVVDQNAQCLSSSRQINYVFGVPWPDLNDGLKYTDNIKSSNTQEMIDLTLIQFYSTKYRDSAPILGWIQRIRNRQITVDGEVVTDPDFTIRIGSKLVYNRLPWKEPNAPYTLQVLYEDEHMIAINKPSGLQVLSGGLFQQRTVLHQLQWKTYGHISSPHTCLSASSREQHPTPVHRLGRGTSGILLCAKTKIAKSRLASYFADGTSSITVRRTSRMENDSRGISKSYRALVQGKLHQDEVQIEQPIGVMHYPGVAKGLYVASSSGKPSSSKVLVLERNIERNETIVQVEILSGRPHQIRIHLAFIGHPLVGDPLYVSGGHPNYSQPVSEDATFAKDGGYHRPANPVPGDCGYHLHAHQLVLRHPTTNK
ncbi:Pseudouridine synthase family protein [Zostera marina]|uniref:Pseudouridine synthase family protein n=1 Tax=Zostera marina TaxID=29655 RepID=A0A0K9P644_ZOSMR|nr:Pseudouridine synthase family protein [Zostera marina]